MTGELPDAAYAAALLALPELWPMRMARLFGMRRAGAGGGSGLFPVPAIGPTRSGPAVWQAVLTGRVRKLGRFAPERNADEAGLEARWALAARRIDVGGLWASLQRDGVRVDLLGTAGYPAELASDPWAPYALFRRGRHGDLAGRRVAIIGTRRCTPLGWDVAKQLGRELGEAGVRTISGLALGIDGAAHEGALSAPAPPIGVVAGGFDWPYPVRHRSLWTQVASSGVLVTEWPPPTRSEGWRFPARNRVIAALAEVVVVVESRAAGGSIVTADEALKRGIPVMAVPGSVRSAASEGTNRLLRDGAAPACSTQDILDALSITSPSPAPAVDDRPSPDAEAGAVLTAVGWEPTPFEVLIQRTGQHPGMLSVTLANLELDGWLAGGGGWWQRIGPRA